MIQEGDLILLYYDEERNYLLRTEDKKFHTDKGFLELSKIIGKEYGSSLKTNKDEIFYVLKPSLYDLTMKLKRKTQIIYPKDAGLILMHNTIFPGARVIEVGVGSGSLTTTLANFIRPEGKVYSYEQNIDFLNNAKENVEKNGLAEWVEFKHRTVIENFDEKDVDFVMIDIGSPWNLVDAAYSALKGGSSFATICPTFEQLTRTVFTLKEKKFTNIRTIEVLVRKILVRPNRTRPEQRMPSHTGWLIFANKTI